MMGAKIALVVPEFHGAEITALTRDQQDQDRPTGQPLQAQESFAVPALRPPSPSPGKTPRRWLWLVVGSAVAAAAVVGYLQPWTQVPLRVAVERVEMQPVTLLLAVSGRVEARHSVNLRPLVSGPLTHVEVEEGERVEATQILARIDTESQEAVVRQAMAGLDAALVAQQQAEATYERSLALGDNVSAVVLDADQRAAQSAGQEVARMTALLDQAQVQLARYTLRAPISGTIVTMAAEVGQIADTSTVLMTLADLTDLVVETDVDEAYAGQITVGQPAVLQLASEGETRTGQVRAVSGLVDEATGGLAVEIGFDTPPVAPIGLTVTANILVDEREAALTIPRTAIVANGAGPVVFLVRDGTAQAHPVTVTDWPAARLIVTDGLAPGDLVILSPEDISDGQRVEPDTP